GSGRSDAAGHATPGAATVHPEPCRTPPGATDHTPGTAERTPKAGGPDAGRRRHRTPSRPDGRCRQGTGGHGSRATPGAAIARRGSLTDIARRGPDATAAGRPPGRPSHAGWSAELGEGALGLLQPGAPGRDGLLGLLDLLGLARRLGLGQPLLQLL